MPWEFRRRARDRCRTTVLVRPARLERATCGLGNRRSIQLSYGRAKRKFFLELVLLQAAHNPGGLCSNVVRCLDRFPAPTQSFAGLTGYDGSRFSLRSSAHILQPQKATILSGAGQEISPKGKPRCRPGGRWSWAITVRSTGRVWSWTSHGRGVDVPSSPGRFGR